MEYSFDELALPSKNRAIAQYMEYMRATYRKVPTMHEALKDLSGNVFTITGHSLGVTDEAIANIKGI